MASIPEREFKHLKVKDYRPAESTVQFSYDGRRVDYRGVVVLSARRAEQEAKKRGEAVSEIGLEFRKVQANLTTKKWREGNLVQRKVESVLRKKSGRCAHFFKSEAKGDHGKLSFEYSVDEDELKTASKLDGKYVLATTL